MTPARPGGLSRVSQLGIAPGLRVGGDDQHPLDLSVVDLAEDAPRAVLTAQRDVGTAQADVVREPAVEQVDDRAGSSRASRYEIRFRASASRRGWSTDLSAVGEPGRRAKRARTGCSGPPASRVVVERHRAQENRERGRRGHRARHRHAGQIGAEQVELVLRELEARAERHVGGVEQHVGPPPRFLQQRGEGRARRRSSSS